MKVLQILPKLDCGGVERGTVDLAKGLIKRGHSAYVISGGGKLVESLAKVGARHIELPVGKKSLSSLFLISKIRKIIEREGIDIVHARSRVPALLAYYAAKPTHAKFITTCHGFYSKHFLSSVMGWGERVIVISRAVGRRMINDFNVSQDRITLVYRGVDLSKYKFDKDKYRDIDKKEKFIIANVGRLTPIKGHKYFIKAVHLALHKKPNIEAWIVGGSGKEKYVESLKQLVAKLGMENVVKFIGVEDDIPSLMKKVDLLVLSTVYPEGFGRVIIEAGASGVSVVATSVGGVLDIIDDGVNGILVSPEDEYSMSDAIVKMSWNKPLLRQFSHNLRDKVEREFTLDKMVDDTIRVYEEELAKKRILVFKLGALGDLILITPSLRLLKKKYPSSFIAVVVDEDLAPAIELSPYVDEIIPFKRRMKRGRFKHLFSVAKKIKKYNFDIAIDFQNNFKTHLLALLSGINFTYGYRRGLLGRFLTNGLDNFSDPIPPVKHQFRVLNLLGISGSVEHLEFWFSDDDARYARDLLRKDKKKQYVGFVLSASSKWPSKRWPVEHFVKLAERFSKIGVEVVLLGDDSASKARDNFNMRSRIKVIDAVGKTDILQLGALIKELDLLISPDSAPLHIASAVKTNVIALFGPTDPGRHLPPGIGYVIIKRNISCVPCYNGICLNGTYKCMKAISVEEVFERAKVELKYKKRLFC